MPGARPTDSPCLVIRCCGSNGPTKIELQADDVVESGEVIERDGGLARGRRDDSGVGLSA